MAAWISCTLLACSKSTPEAPDAGDAGIECAEGYELDDATSQCIDIDECDPAAPRHNCDPQSACTNLDGSFSCAPCPAPYDDVNGDGTRCEICAAEMAVAMPTPRDTGSCDGFELVESADLLARAAQAFDDSLVPYAESLQFLDSSAIFRELTWPGTCRRGDATCAPTVMADWVDQIRTLAADVRGDLLVPGQVVQSGPCSVEVAVPTSVVCDEVGDCLPSRYELSVHLFELAPGTIYAELEWATDGIGPVAAASANPVDLVVADGRLSISMDIAELVEVFRIIRDVETEHGLEADYGLPDTQSTGVVEVDLRSPPDTETWRAALHVRESVSVLGLGGAGAGDRFDVVLEPACPTVLADITPPGDGSPGAAAVAVSPGRAEVAIPMASLVSPRTTDFDSIDCGAPGAPTCCGGPTGCCLDAVGAPVACPCFDPAGWPIDCATSGDPTPVGVSCPYSSAGKSYDCLPAVGQLRMSMGTAGQTPAVQPGSGPRADLALVAAGEPGEVLQGRNLTTQTAFDASAAPLTVARNCLGFEPDLAVEAHPCDGAPTPATYLEVLSLRTTGPIGIDATAADGYRGVALGLVHAVEGLVTVHLANLGLAGTPSELADDTIRFQWTAVNWPAEVATDEQLRLDFTAPAPAPIAVQSGALTIEWNYDADAFGRSILIDAAAAARCGYFDAVECSSEQDCNGDGATLGPDVGCDGAGCVCGADGLCQANHFFDALFDAECPQRAPLTHDTTIDAMIDANFGTAPTLLVGGSFGSPVATDRYRILARFDTPDLASLFSGMPPSAAFIALYSEVFAAEASGVLEVWGLEAVWDSSTVQWSTAPALTGLYAVEDFAPWGEVGWHHLDATEAVLDAIANPAEDHGVLLRTSEATDAQEFPSVDSSQIDRRPHLVLLPPRPPRL